MRLEMGTFPVERITFGSETRYAHGHLEVDKEAVIDAVHADPRIASVDLEMAYPGESTRIWPVRDVIEPRIKVEGPGVIYPGTAGRSITTVGEGRTHRLAGMGIAEVSSVNWHDAGGDFVEVYLDMSGPWADLIPLSRLPSRSTSLAGTSNRTRFPAAGKSPICRRLGVSGWPSAILSAPQYARCSQF